MEFLYDIPVIGMVIQFVVYVIVQLPVLLPTIMAAAVPIILGALCAWAIGATH